MDQGISAQTKAKRRIVVVTCVVVAIGALALGARYQEDTAISEPVFSGSAVDGGGERTDDPNAERETLTISPIQEWLPRSGVGSTCTEPVGVDLIPGYAAILTINGVTLTDDQLNGPDEVTGAIPASRTLEQFTYGPEEDCPNGALLRPRDNVVEACIYLVDEGPDSCHKYPAFNFNAL